MKKRHTKRKQEYWSGNGIQESRSKRARIGRYIPNKQLQKTTMSLNIIKKYKMQCNVWKIQTQKVKDTTCSVQLSLNLTNQ